MLKLGVRHPNTQGKALNNVSEIMTLFTPIEGENSFIYGRIGEGKTSTATAMILELLNRGEVVWANWKIDWKGYDERESFAVSLMKFFTGRDIFFKYNPENFHYFHPDNINVAMLGKLVNVHIFIDEGQWLMNSHDRTDDPDKRKLILHGRHYCRSLNIISQRPSNVFKDMRSQVHRWYKCEKVLTFPVLVFRRTEYQDMKDDLPDEELPVSKRLYILPRNVQDAYDTHAMRADDAIELPASFNAFSLGFVDRLKVVLGNLGFARGDASPAQSQQALPLGDKSLTKRSIRDIKKG